MNRHFFGYGCLALDDHSLISFACSYSTKSPLSPVHIPDEEEIHLDDHLAMHENSPPRDMLGLEEENELSVPS